MQHALTHGNVQPGKYGEPFFEIELDDFVLDLLHLAELNVPKIIWKHAILNNCSDDAREQISDQLKEWKHPLDCRRKDDNRARAQKWFTGEAWASFLAGERGSPGGPRAMAKLVLIVAEDLRERGVTCGSKDSEAESPESEASNTTPPIALPPEPQLPNRGRGRDGRGRAGRGRGRAAFAERVTDSLGVGAADGALSVNPTAQAVRAGVEHVPTEMEKKADPADLKIIRDVYGSRANTIINALLSFDAYMDWYYDLKESIPFLCDMSIREERAFENMCTAIDMQEIVERSSINNHKSFMLHGAIFKVTKDILRVGDAWAVGLSSLELLNAETKRAALSSGSRNLTLRDAGEARKPLTSKQGPAQLVTTKGYSTTMAISTLRSLLIQQYLRRGDGLASIPNSRRKERLFQHGRTKLESAGTSAADRAATYDPRSDSCVKAFVQMLAEILATTG